MPHAPTLSAQPQLDLFYYTDKESLAVSLQKLPCLVSDQKDKNYINVSNFAAASISVTIVKGHITHSVSAMRQ